MDLIQEWHDAIGAACEWPNPGNNPALSRWITRVTVAGNALAKDYEIAVAQLQQEAKGRVRVHLALAEAIGGDAASKINDEPMSAPTTEG